MRWVWTAAALTACAAVPRVSDSWLAVARETPDLYGSLRPLRFLDVSADGQLTFVDHETLEAISREAAAEATRRGLSLSVRDTMYEGAGKALLSEGRDIPWPTLQDRQVVEIWVESRWMALQARLALALGTTALDAPFFGQWASDLPGYNADSMAGALVCDAIAALDLAPVRDAGLRPAAVFDLDNTVWRGSVMESLLRGMVFRKVVKSERGPDLIEFLGRLPGVDAKALAGLSVEENLGLLWRRATDMALPKEQRVSAKDSFFTTVRMLEGVEVTHIEALALAIMREGREGREGHDEIDAPAYAQNTYDHPSGCGMRRIISTLVAKGFDVYFLSATADELVAAAAAEYGVARHQALGSLLGTKDGVYDGSVRANTYGIKRHVVRQWLPAPPLFVFGDSPTSDLPMMLEAAVAAFMVNPSPALLAEDEKQTGGKFVALSFDRVEGDAK